MLKQVIAGLAIVAALAVVAPSFAQGEVSMSVPSKTDRVAVNGVEIYYEIHGEGSPLVMLHGGVNPSDMFGAPLAAMAEHRQVIAIHMRGHGLSSDAATPWSSQQMADDVDALLGKLGFDRVDVMGYSLGGGVALQTAIRHPDRVGRLVVIGTSVKSSGNYPEVEAAFKQMPAMAATIGAQLAQSPLAALYPDVDWEAMMRKTGEMNQGAYDWSADIAEIKAPTLLIFADADMMYPEHIAEMYRLFGGGTRDAGFDGASRPTVNQLAIIPGATHYDVIHKASVAEYAKAFLAQ
ncbi:alpha/beta fold hydrolase [Devosia sp. Root685]|uniref:alpha/beta fold hydrolase n=1 Tax=Devosia sp. Root685 TaxID=1736587 RepID=UPI000A86AFC4|nr:alpha/beta hydrolase [Devosia sp. Root685]